MAQDDEPLIPDEITVDEINSSWNQDFVKRSITRFVRSSIEDVINKALLLGRNDLLDSTQINSIILDLRTLIDYAENCTCNLYEVIIDHLFHNALNGTESDRDASLRVTSVFLTTPHVYDTTTYFLNLVRKVLVTKIPSPKEIEAGVVKKPGLMKMNYLRSTLPRLEIDLRRLFRATEIAAFMYIHGIGDSFNDDFVSNVIRELILSGDCPTLQTFCTVCTMLKTINEKRVTWGFQSVLTPHMKPYFLNDIFWTLEDFLLAYRVSHKSQPQALTFLHGIFTMTFKGLDRNVLANSQYAKACKRLERPAAYKVYTSDQLYWLVLEKNYSQVYDLAHSINPRIFRGPGSPTFFPGKSRHDLEEEERRGQWITQIEDISILKCQGYFLPSSISTQDNQKTSPKGQKAAFYKNGVVKVKVNTNPPTYSYSMRAVPQPIKSEVKRGVQQPWGKPRVVQPEVNRGVQREVNRGVQPEVNRGVQPEVNRGVQPEVNRGVQQPWGKPRVVQPEVNRGVQREVNRGVQQPWGKPRVVQPEVNRGVQPEVNRRVQREVNRGVQQPWGKSRVVQPEVNRGVQQAWVKPEEHRWVQQPEVNRGVQPWGIPRVQPVQQPQVNDLDDDWD